AFVLGVLEVPGHRAVIDVEGNGRVGEEVVARAELGVEHRHRIGGTPDGHASGRIVRAGLPQRTTAGPPGIVVVLPGLVAGFARARDGVGPPLLFAALGIEGGEPAAGTPVALGLADQNLAFGGERSRREAFTRVEFPVLFLAADLLVPDDLARLGV